MSTPATHALRPSSLVKGRPSFWLTRRTITCRVTLLDTKFSEADRIEFAALQRDTLAAAEQRGKGAEGGAAIYLLNRRTREDPDWIKRWRGNVDLSDAEFVIALGAELLGIETPKVSSTADDTARDHFLAYLSDDLSTYVRAMAQIDLEHLGLRETFASWYRKLSSGELDLVAHFGAATRDGTLSPIHIEDVAEIRVTAPYLTRFAAFMSRAGRTSPLTGIKTLAELAELTGQTEEDIVGADGKGHLLQLRAFEARKWCARISMAKFIDPPTPKPQITKRPKEDPRDGPGNILDDDDDEPSSATGGEEDE